MSLLRSFSRFRFAILATSACAGLAFACGGISDPTKGGGEKVATVSGALTGTSVPANARVALVWRTTASSPTDGGYAVGDDVPVVAGKFTMSLAIPPAAYFANIDGQRGFDNTRSSEPSQTTGNAGTADPSPPPPLPSGGSTSGGGKMPAFASQLSPRDNVSGGITSPMTGAVAGFVVYVDTNNNGKLDLSGSYAASTDEILGGNRELVLTYLKDGGALDYEKLRDTSGILPAQGFNLAWTVGKRWMPLNVVELKLDPKQGLPSPVCSSSGAYSGGGSSGSFDPVATPLPAPNVEPPPGSSSGSAGSSGSGPIGTADGGTGSSSGGSTSGGPTASYPSPTDPNLHCSPDGRSFYWTDGTGCPPPPPPPVGLCAGDYGDVSYPCASAGRSETLVTGAPVPPGWPCPVTTDADGGPAPTDAGAGG